MFSLFCAWINGWVNTREAGDLRRHQAHYDVIVMVYGGVYSLQWRHNTHSGVSNRRPLECLFHRVGPVTRKPFSFDDAIMYYSVGMWYISLWNVCAAFETDRFVGWIFLKAVVWNKKVSFKSKDLRWQFFVWCHCFEKHPTHSEICFFALFEFSLFIYYPPLYIGGIYTTIVGHFQTIPLFFVDTLRQNNVAGYKTTRHSEPRLRHNPVISVGGRVNYCSIKDQWRPTESRDPDVIKALSTRRTSISGSLCRQIARTFLL